MGKCSQAVMETEFGLLDRMLKARTSGVAFSCTQLARQVKLQGCTVYMKQ